MSQVPVLTAPFMANESVGLGTVGPGVRVLLFSIALACCTHFVQADDRPVEITCLKHTVGRGQVQEYSVHLTLRNGHGKPMWFLFPVFNSGLFPKDGVFRHDGDGQPFTAMEYHGQGGWAVDLVFRGGYRELGSEFRAFHLPAHATLDFNGYRITDYKQIDRAIVATAPELIVNGQTPLEKWLPYNVTADKHVAVQASTDTTYLDWDEKHHRPRQDYRAEKVRQIKANGFRRWSVRFSTGRAGLAWRAQAFASDVQQATIEALINQLRSKDANERRKAEKALKSLGDVAWPALHFAVQTDSDTGVRRRCVPLGPGPGTIIIPSYMVVPVLIRAC
jgi:hypothetical protein